MALRVCWLYGLFLGSWLIALPLGSYAQNKTIDSLLRQLETAQLDTTKLKLHYSLYYALNGYDKEKAKEHLEAGYVLARKTNDKRREAYFFKEMGGLLFDLAKYEQSRSSYDSAITLYEELMR